MVVLVPGLKLVLVLVVLVGEYTDAYVIGA